MPLHDAYDLSADLHAQLYSLIGFSAKILISVMEIYLSQVGMPWGSAKRRKNGSHFDRKLREEFLVCVTIIIKIENLH